MNRLKTDKRVAVVSALVEGCSIRSTVRMTGAAKNTVAKLLADLGAMCREYHDLAVRSLHCKRVQCDEIWSFCYSKAKNVPAEHSGEYGYGDVWTWVAIDSDTKLAISYHVGLRTEADATAFAQDLSARTLSIGQLTTDGLGLYVDAVYNAFGRSVNYAQQIKQFAATQPDEARYSPAKCTAIKNRVVIGDPDPDYISTSHVERQNLTMRMSMRRFTRLTNGFSKKIENHEHAIALHFAHYNFCRVHGTTGKTPAMAAGIATEPWTIERLIQLTREL